MLLRIKVEDDGDLDEGERVLKDCRHFFEELDHVGQRLVDAKCLDPATPNLAYAALEQLAGFGELTPAAGLGGQDTATPLPTGQGSGVRIEFSRSPPASPDFEDLEVPNRATSIAAERVLRNSEHLPSVQYISVPDSPKRATSVELVRDSDRTPWGFTFGRLDNGSGCILQVKSGSKLTRLASARPGFVSRQARQCAQHSG